MGARKMEFDCIAEPRKIGPVSPPADWGPVTRQQRLMMDLMDNLHVAQENMAFRDAAAGTAAIVHDLDPDCRCVTCAQADEIRSQYE